MRAPLPFTQYARRKVTNESELDSPVSTNGLEPSFGCRHSTNPLLQVPHGSCVSLSASSFGVSPRPGCSVNVTVPRDGFGGSR